MLLFVLSLLAVACGSDEPTESAEERQPELASVVVERPTPELDVVSTTDVTPIVERFEQRLQAVQATDDWCTAAALLEEGVADLDNMDVRDTRVVEATLTGRAQVLEAAQALAPAEIADDVARSNEGFNEIRDLFEGAEWNALDVDLVALDRANADMTLSAFNVAQYNFEVCGVGQDPGAPPASPGQGLQRLFGPDANPVQTVNELVTRGFTADEAQCLVDGFDIGETVIESTGNLLDTFETCSIDVQLLAGLDS